MDSEQLSVDLLSAFNDRDADALRRLNAHYERRFDFDDLRAEIWRRVYAYRQRSSRVEKNYLAPEEARTLIAQDSGFGNWEALLDAQRRGAPPVAAFVIDAHRQAIAPARYLRPSEWEDLITAAAEHRVTAFASHGLVTDEVVQRLTTLETVTELSLSGSRLLTDDGVRLLARMPQLQRLDLSGTRVSDEGLDVLPNLPDLRHFELMWNRTVTDRGVAHLRHCDRLERVQMMGSNVGNGLIAALAGKPRLSALSTGIAVDDEGLSLLRDLPHFARLHAVSQAAHDGEPVEGAQLLLDGPFTDAGLGSLASLEGIAALDLFWHAQRITPAGFAHLAAMPHLQVLGADGRLGDDVALAHMGAMPRLKRLRIQEAIASDAGFEALSRSRTLEALWGRECAGFGSRGFVALSTIPSLQTLGIGLANVEDRALATLRDFPSLRELTPIGLKDPAFAHVGRCHRLERLICMYCRDTTDAATAHVQHLPLRKYYAGLTGITDRSLQILSGIATLEQVELWECRGVTDAGVQLLAQLPNLREVALDHLPNVTDAATRVFPASVRVRYSP